MRKRKKGQIETGGGSKKQQAVISILSFLFLVSPIFNASPQSGEAKLSRKKKKAIGVEGEREMFFQRTFRWWVPHRRKRSVFTIN